MQEFTCYGCPKVVSVEGDVHDLGWVTLRYTMSYPPLKDESKCSFGYRITNPEYVVCCPECVSNGKFLRLCVDSVSTLARERMGEKFVGQQ